MNCSHLLFVLYIMVAHFVGVGTGWIVWRAALPIRKPPAMAEGFLPKCFQT
jgi:hypothetical protein